MPTAFTPLMQSSQTGDGRCSLDVPEDWLQGRSVFGGLQVAIAVRAMRSLVPDMPLRTLQVLFAAPVAGGKVLAEARLLRAGKNTAHVEARIIEGTQTLALVVAVFGMARSSVAARTPEQLPVSDDKALPFRFIPGITPSFTQHFSSRWLRGPLPFAGIKENVIVVETSLRDAGPVTEGHVIAIADLIPPIALSHFRTPAPGSSMTWMLDFLVERFDHLATERWRVDAEMQFAADGYSNQSATIWAPDGTAVALSRQSMVVFG